MIALRWFFLTIPFLLTAQGNFTKEKLKHIHRQIDSIMIQAIKSQAFPGAQLLVTHKDSLVYHESFGYHTYDSLTGVRKTDIYDLASVTKIAAPLLGIMKLYEDGRLDLDAPFSTYWKPWRGIKDKNEITLRELLAHQSGLIPYIVFLNEVKRGNDFKRRFIRNKASKKFSKKAYLDIYVRDRFAKKMFRKINRSKVNDKKKYSYSGLASLIYPTLIEDMINDSYEIFLNTNFYKPLGCKTLSFNPAPGLINRILPTEQDSLFRKDLVRGYVHDENAALLGGVSGNAGLFGSADDLARLMGMLVNKGEYQGKRYFKSSTVDEFIRIQYPENENRRGLGFDKPLIGNSEMNLQEAYPAPEVSPESFGHSGFTGTFVWADPAHRLVFIFLSNRVYPTRANRNLYNLNVRPSLQRIFYQALNSPD